MARVDRAGVVLLAGVMAAVSGRQQGTATACCRYYSLWVLQLIVGFAFIGKHLLVDRICFCTGHINIMSCSYNVQATVVISVGFAFISKRILVERIFFCTGHINAMSSNYNVHVLY